MNDRVVRYVEEKLRNRGEFLSASCAKRVLEEYEKLKIEELGNGMVIIGDPDLKDGEYHTYGESK
jgi:hypothetical protein